MNPVELGKNLEEIIQNASLKIPNVTQLLRENEIKTYFNDQSINGVDHWIQHGNIHVLIQDKWKESMNQQEISQFLTCADRIHSRLPPESELHLIWCSKKEPTSHSRKLLEERGVNIVCCSLNIESLAKLVILQICECLEEDSTAALQTIKMPNKPNPLAPCKREVVPNIQETPYDETNEGKSSIDQIKNIINNVYGIFNKIDFAIGSTPGIDINTIWQITKPKTKEEFWSGKMSKVDFTGFMKTAKNLCWATAKKRLSIHNLWFYTKLRRWSVELAKFAVEYEGKRKLMLQSKSSFAKMLPVFKENAEPITEAEFIGSAEHCQDAYATMMNPISRKFERMPCYGRDFGYYNNCFV
jgi:hypothetical protein